MTIRRAKTIAEYAIKKWLIKQNFAMEHFTLTMDGNVGILKDQQREVLLLTYDPDTRSVHVKE